MRKVAAKIWLALPTSAVPFMTAELSVKVPVTPIPTADGPPNSGLASGLDVWLTQHGIQRLIISGMRTEQCCETTTRHASDLGWQVDFVTEATLTFDMLQANGEPLSAADIVTRTETVLRERFATLCTVTQAIERNQTQAG